MKKWLTIIGTAALLLYPFAAIAADYGSQPLQDQKTPPVAQTLVREGDFAIKLAAELDLGKPSDEATAEDMLATAGVVPSNGWLSDYPMTPEIIGQLKDAVSTAAAEGKLKMGNEEAVKGLYYLAAQMNLPTPAGTGSEAQQGSEQTPAAPPNPSVVNNYYYDQGPPVITYYPPPYDYWYMYNWVPYPVFWFGFWFPGFYICHNFTTVVVSPVFLDRRVVTNHVIDPVTRRVAIVDPVSRVNGRVRPGTVLRTANGRTFNNLPEMRREMGRLPANSPEARTPAVRDRGFTTRESQSGAKNIYRRSVDQSSAPASRLNSRESRLGGGGAYGPTRQSNGQAHRYAEPAPSGRSYHDGPSLRGGKRQAAPRMLERSYNNNYNYGGSRQGRGGSYSSPRTPERTFQAPVTRGSGGRESTSLFNGGRQERGRVGRGF
jgi:hypothetical protein